MAQFECMLQYLPMMLIRQILEIMMQRKTTEFDIPHRSPVRTAQMLLHIDLGTMTEAVFSDA